ncbi:MAG: response regulator transcription factor [Anaerolineae bacterium]
MKQLILAIDDNRNAIKLLTDYLSDQEFNVISAKNGREALTTLETDSPDLILLDIMMPLMDGYQFISRVRRTSNVPIIMLTAKRAESDVVRGFELGADDYMTKPFGMRELLMRIRAVLRRSPHSVGTDLNQVVGDLELEKQHLIVKVKGVGLILTPAEFCVLEKLAQSAEVPVHRATLSTHLIQHNFSGSENTLKTHIRNLRQKLEPDPADPMYIETVFGVGYRLKINHEFAT